MVVPRWPTQVWWPKLMMLADSSTNTTTKEKDNPYPSKQAGGNTPTPPSSRTNNLPLVRKSLENQGLSAAASNINRGDKGPLNNIDLTSRNGSVTAVRGKLMANSFFDSVSDGINFLSALYECGVGYSPFLCY